MRGGPTERRSNTHKRVAAAVSTESCSHLVNYMCPATGTITHPETAFMVRVQVPSGAVLFSMVPEGEPYGPVLGTMRT